MNPVNDHEDGTAVVFDTLPVLQLTKREAMAIGYVHAWACSLLDRGIDPRKEAVPALADQVMLALKNEPHPKPPRDLPLIIALIFGMMLGGLGSLALWIMSWAPYVR